MKCIALEPATTAPSLALVEDAQILREVSLPSGREQGGAIFSILREWRADFERLDCWAVGLGPGSFTGIRAAIATMQGLNFPFRKPIYGVNSHDAVALEPLPPEDEFGTGDARHMCVVSDARRDEIYVTIYERENEAWRPYRDTHIVSIDALAAETADDASIFFTGPALGQFRAHISMVFGNRAQFAPEAVFPKARRTAQIAMEMHGGQRVACTNLEPVYLRPVSFVKAKG
ncbi:tRNA (adenosine(37)-N6)-threonylcarbamoyltransferase complex dimerization subunit type 1 TsaB [Oscillatoria laete-virens NRMC-F 0139]|nr:tRNA (adenosine(37)-N6)-threonylcarbamoyltransferase complex dimerization subunit type 1 TsaB [Oscillatoria laete-virens]MDL5053123.1 tRNA (adenosine(37)-N6)-threonylcarbamoyltransferase complex dimerization subunit type 1 TsaB [Oscillatoria laete-virens NRMC-F 0139]